MAAEASPDAGRRTAPDPIEPAGGWLPLAPDSGLRTGTRRAAPTPVPRLNAGFDVQRAQPPECNWLPASLPGEEEFQAIGLAARDAAAEVRAPGAVLPERRPLPELARQADPAPLEFRLPKRVFAGVFVPQLRGLPLRPRMCWGPPPPAASPGDAVRPRTPVAARPGEKRLTVRSA